MRRTNEELFKSTRYMLCKKEEEKKTKQTVRCIPHTRDNTEDRDEKKQTNV